MEITLEHITPDAEFIIGKYAAICYDANLDREACIRRAAKVSRDGHLACLRFAYATFNIKGISRVCSHQMVRSKFLDFLQRSQRYCKETDSELVIPPTLGDYADLVSSWNEQTMLRYKLLIDAGIRKEDARFVLPEATCTELNVVGNFQAWKDFIRLRADKHAQWEIREVAKQINNLLHKECPNLFHWMP